jgi:hypothetical protein
MSGRKSTRALQLSELPGLRQLRKENGKLKRLGADLSLNRQIRQEIVHKSCKARQRRELGEWTETVFALRGRRKARRS